MLAECWGVSKVVWVRSGCPQLCGAGGTHAADHAQLLCELVPLVPRGWLGWDAFPYVFSPVYVLVNYGSVYRVQCVCVAMSATELN